MPALADRPEDIPELARHFLARFAAEEGKRIRGFDAERTDAACAYRWPGNVRQLENAVFRAVVLAEGDEIGAADLPQIAVAGRAPGGCRDGARRSSRRSRLPIILPRPRHRRSIGADVAGSIAPHHPAMLSLLDARGEARPLEEIETEVIRFAVGHYRGQMSEVARRLQIGRSTLYRKLDNLGLGPRMAETDSGPVVAG